MAKSFRLELVAVAAAFLLGAYACNPSRPDSGGATNVPPGYSDLDSSAIEDSGPCAPPYTCDSGDAGTDGSLKENAGGPNGGSSSGGPGTCDTDQIAYRTEELFATGPTGGFVSAYNNALAATNTGPFAPRLYNFDSVTSSDFLVKVGGTTSTGSNAKLTETGAIYPVSLNGTALTIPATAATFHLAFTTDSNPAGDLEVGGFALGATLDPGCGALTDVTATLYISSSQSSVTLTSGGSTIGSLLGAPSANVGGLGFTGWAVPLSGFSANEVTVQ